MTKNIMKRTTAGVLSLLCAAGIVAGQASVISAFADTPVVVSEDVEPSVCADYEYLLLEDGSAKLVKYSGSDEVVEIPSELDGYTVTSIEDYAFRGNETLTAVTVPESVTDIGDFAFAYCPALTSVTLPDSITEISKCLFCGSKALTSVNIPDGVTKIGTGAFSYCEELASVTIPASVTDIGIGAFCGCTSMTSVTIPETVESIGAYAFGYDWDEDEGKFVKQDGLKIYCTYNTEGHFYAASEEMEFEAIGSVPPEVYYEKQDGAVKITWSFLRGASKVGIAGFVNGKWKLLGTAPALLVGPTPSYTIKNLTPGKEYKVAVIPMYNGKWSMNFSNAITVTPNAPKYPVVKSQVKGSQFRLGWSAVDNAEGYAVAVYQDGWKVLKAVSPETFIYTSAKLEPGTYHVAVAAKVDGKWDTTNIKSRAVTITIE